MRMDDKISKRDKSIIEAYTNQQKSLRTIANENNCSTGYIYLVIEKANVPRRVKFRSKPEKSIEREQLIIKAYEAGTSGTKIAKTFHTGTDYVYKVLRRNSVPLRRPSQSEKAINKERDKEILEQYQNGVELSQIATTYDIGKSKVHLVLEDSRTSRNRHGKPQPSKLDGYLKSKYGIDKQTYNQILKDQDGLCAICRKPETATDPKNQTIKRLAVDHDHKTNKVRGLLCTKCNIGIGIFQDSEELLYLAINYLKKHKK